MTVIVPSPTVVFVPTSTGTSGPPGPPGSGSTIGVKDEGSTVSSVVERINFSGAGASVSGGGADVVVNIPGGMNGLANRSAIAALATGTGLTAYLNESGREGLFVWDGSNLSSKVSADTAQGIYIAPASASTGASGAWVRKFTGPVNPEWFGIVRSANSTDTSHAVANSTAWAAMIATLVTRAFVAITNFQSLEPVQFPNARYHFNDTLDLTDGSVEIFGTAPAGHPNVVGTVLKFPAGVDGIRGQGIDTSGATSAAVSSSASGYGSLLRNIVLQGAYSGTEGEYHGVHMRTPMTCVNVVVIDFQGDGFHIWADTGQSGSGPNYGNANGFMLWGCSAERNRNGVSIAEADANAYVIMGGQLNNNRQWGIKGDEDDLSLGGAVYGAHFDSNGITGDGPPTVVHSSGHYYGVKIGQETWCSTNAPSGTTADNQGWYYTGVDGAAVTGRPAWVSGTTYRAGGSVTARSANSHAQFNTCYHEPGQGLPQVNSPNWIVGGVLASVRNIGSSGSLRHAAGKLESASTIHTAGDMQADGESHWLGPNTGTPVGIVEYELRSTAALSHFNFGYYASGARVRLNGSITHWDNNGLIYAAIGAHYFKTGTGAYNTSTLVMSVSGNVVTLDTDKALVGSNTAAPTTGAHARGEVVFNSTPSAGGKVGWVCVTAGTPGTWKPFGVIDA